MGLSAAAGAGATVVAGATVETQDAAGGTIRDGAVAWSGGRIEWVGPTRELPARFAGAARLEAHGALLTPGLIDCHTHIVHAGDRAAEFAARLRGETYASIAASGGGILATVRATRAASVDALLAAALPRIDALLAEGVTTLEIKSGYGLDLAAERRMLQAARRVAAVRDLEVVATCLAAHAVPPEFAGRADAWIDEICQQVLPALHAERLVDAVDAYCERGAFTTAQVRRVFGCAARLGLPVKLHAEQFSASGAAALAAESRAQSADHLEWLDAAGVDAMRRAGCVAVLLPGAWFFLRESRRPPVEALRAAGVPMAVATDCNPGTSPLGSLLAAMTMACVSFDLSPQEALAGVTVHAARALGLTADRGRIAAGLRADLALWQVESVAALCGRLGASPLRACWIGGRRRGAVGG
jgi:imidazolonepropionase